MSLSVVKTATVRTVAVIRDEPVREATLGDCQVRTWGGYCFLRERKHMQGSPAFELVRDPLTCYMIDQARGEA